MGHSIDATGKPTITPTPTQTVADIQAAVNYAELTGGLRKVTSSQRTSLTSSQTEVGWLISETDTGRLYLRTASSAQGVLIYGDTGWVALPLAAGWTQVSGDPPEYRVRNGALQFRGRLNATTGAPQEPFTVPLVASARPDRAVPQLVGTTGGSGASFVVQVGANGVVTVFKGSNAVGALALAGFVPYSLS